MPSRDETTPRLALKPYEEQHRVAFVSWMRDPAAWAFVRKTFPTETTPDGLLNRFLTLPRDEENDPLIRTIVCDETGELIGHVELKTTEKTVAGQRELVYAVREKWRGQGYATAAVRTLLRSYPRELTVIAVASPSNHASRRVLEKVGFQCTSTTATEEWHEITLA